LAARRPRQRLFIILRGRQAQLPRQLGVERRDRRRGAVMRLRRFVETALRFVEGSTRGGTPTLSLPRKRERGRRWRVHGSSSCSAGPIGCTSGRCAFDFGVLPDFFGESGFFAMAGIWGRGRVRKRANMVLAAAVTPLHWRAAAASAHPANAARPSRRWRLDGGDNTVRTR